jgi:Uma2 family endonuclease
MTTTSEKSRISPEEFLKLPDSVSYELVDGKLVERNMGAKASAIAAAIVAILRNFIKPRKLGHLMGSECSYQCFPDDPGKLRRPDVSLVSKGRLDPDEPPDGQIKIPPDLAIEVLSPGDLAYEIDAKVAEYQQAGVRLIWVVNPRTRTVRIHRPADAPNGPISSLGDSDTITGEEVLPGFESRVSEFLDI